MMYNDLHVQFYMYNAYHWKQIIIVLTYVSGSAHEKFEVWNEVAPVEVLMWVPRS